MIWGGSGAAVSTVKSREAGVGSVLPAASVARTRKVWAPSARALAGVCVSPGPEQAPNGSESKRHSKLAPGSEEKPNDGEALVVSPEGPESIVVSGGAVSTVKLREAGVGSVLPAASVARTRKVWEPSARALAGVCVSPGPEEAPNGSESKRHSKLAPGSEEKPNDGEALVVSPEGPESIVVSGGAVSTVKLREAGVGSVLPAASVART